MRVLVWQWGRRGGGPRFAADLAAGMRLLPGVDVMLSLSSSAELLHGPAPPPCELPVTTYAGRVGFAWRLLRAPLTVRGLARRIAAMRPDIAVCAMPGPLDLLMMAALRRCRVPAAVIVHDAELHPGDGVPFQMRLQRAQVRRADAVITISRHVADRLREQHLVPADRLALVPQPPFLFGLPASPPQAHGGALRLLFFGRLLHYKGLDLLAAAVSQLGTRAPWELRVVGSGPESTDLDALRAVPGVTVENRWVPEAEIGALIAWADAVVLPYREASQSGVAPAAVAAGRHIVATRVGGLVEQVRDAPLARLCEPDAASLAAALRDLIDAPPAPLPVPPPVDPRLAWRDMAEQLLAKVPKRASPHH